MTDAFDAIDGVYVYVYAWMWICMCRCVCVYVRVDVCVCVYICVNVCLIVCMCTCVYACICMCNCKCVVCVPDCEMILLLLHHHHSRAACHIGSRRRPRVKFAGAVWSARPSGYDASVLELACVGPVCRCVSVRRGLCCPSHAVVAPRCCALLSL